MLEWEGCQGEGKVALCLTVNRRGRADPEIAEKGEGDRQQPSLGELYRGRFVQRLNLNPPQACTVFYAIEIISAFHLLNSDSAKQT